MNFRKNPHLIACLTFPLVGLFGWGLALVLGHRGDQALAAAGIFAYVMCLVTLRAGEWLVDLPKGISIQRAVYGAREGVWFAALMSTWERLDGGAPVGLAVQWLVFFVIFGAMGAVFARPAAPDIAAMYEGPDAFHRSRWLRSWVMAYPILTPAFCVFVVMSIDDVIIMALLIASPIVWLPPFKEKREQPAKHSAEWYAMYLGLPIVAAVFVWWMFGLDV